MSDATSVFYRLGSALFAFCLWGGWAYWINSVNSFSAGVKAGIVQGVISAVITLIMVRLVTALYRLITINGFKQFLPSLLTVMLTGSAGFAVHTVAGTPSVVKTLAPALTVAFMFCLFTTWKLSRSH